MLFLRQWPTRNENRKYNRYNRYMFVGPQRTALSVPQIDLLSIYLSIYLCMYLSHPQCIPCSIIPSHRRCSHHITLHHITSRYITLHHITSRYITSHHITSHHWSPVTLHYRWCHHFLIDLSIPYHTMHHHSFHPSSHRRIMTPQLSCLLACDLWRHQGNISCDDCDCCD